LAHQLGRYRKEVLPVFKLPGAARQAQICFVYDSGALESMVHTLASQVVVCDASKLLVDERHERIKRCRIARSPPF
jgi:hypothetical protein